MLFVFCLHSVDLGFGIVQLHGWHLRKRIVEAPEVVEGSHHLVELHIARYVPPAECYIAFSAPRMLIDSRLVYMLSSYAILAESVTAGEENRVFVDIHADRTLQ